MNTANHTDPHPDNSVTVGLLSNPYSGRNRKQLDTIGRIVADYPNVHHQQTRDAGHIAEVLAGFADQSIELLAINGGDGTVARTLAHLLEEQPFPVLPRVVLLPGGTTNMNVGDVGLRGSLASAVKRLCEWSTDRNKPHENLVRPILRVTGGTGQPAVYGMFFGAGAIIQDIEFCRTRIYSKGISSGIGAALTLARTIWGIARNDRRFVQPVPMSVALNGSPASPARDTRLLLVSSLERLILGIRPWWGQGSGPLHTSLVLDNADRLLRNLPSLLRGRPNRYLTEARGYYSHNIDRISLAFDGTWTLDGEDYQASIADGPVTITNGGDVTFVRL